LGLLKKVTKTQLELHKRLLKKHLMLLEKAILILKSPSVQQPLMVRLYLTLYLLLTKVELGINMKVTQEFLTLLMI
jgi:hypothetical protein